MEERVYTIPLSDAWKKPRVKHARRAVSLLRVLLARNMNVQPGDVKLSNRLNNEIWSSSAKKPKRKVRVKVVENEKGVWAYLPDEKVEKAAEVEEKKAEPEEAAKKEADNAEGAKKEEPSG